MSTGGPTCVGCRRSARHRSPERCSVQSPAPPGKPRRTCSRNPCCSSHGPRPGVCPGCGLPCPCRPLSPREGSESRNEEDVQDEDIEEQRRTGRFPNSWKRSMSEALSTERPMRKFPSWMNLRSTSEEDQEEHRSSMPGCRSRPCEEGPRAPSRTLCRRHPAKSVNTQPRGQAPQLEGQR